MGIYRFDVFRTPNIGVFLKANEEFILVPRGLAKTKEEKLKDYLRVESVRVDIAGTRLLGPLVCMNNRGIVLPRTAEDDEVRILREGTGLVVERLPSKYNCVGNLVVANDKGALASDMLGPEDLAFLKDVLDVPIERATIASYRHVGSVVFANDKAALIHPSASEEEVELVKEVLKVEVEPATVNGGVPFVSSGILANSKGVVVGSLTTPIELMIMSRLFGL
ncbi:MAG: translation initiation factor IF-6 [Thaumarchaeota archaeon]|nr:translation initiation factor IF-6 [Nitrososphaerota archaeon]